MSQMDQEDGRVPSEPGCEATPSASQEAVFAESHPSRGGEILEDPFYISGIRTQRAFLLLEGELDALAWAPWWARRRIIKRVKAQTKFEDGPEA